jgi:hypothetical protein
LKDFVQLQKKDFEADQAKGRKSPANRGPPTSRTKGGGGGGGGGGSFNNTGGAGGKVLHATTHNKDIDASSDQLSDTTTVERYMNEAVGKPSEVSDMIMKLASQMDKAEIDKAIAVLQHLRTLSVVNEPPPASPTPTSNQVSQPKRSTVSQQTHFAQRRSKSNPPGLSSSPPYPYPSTTSTITSGGGGASLLPPRVNAMDPQAASSSEDSDNEGEEEVRQLNDPYDSVAFFPAATQNPTASSSMFSPPSAHNMSVHNSKQLLHHRSESEASYTTSTGGGSRASTPCHSMHKRSPIPGTMNIHATPQEVTSKHDCCPVVERPGTLINQKPQAFLEIVITDFSQGPGGLVREISAGAIQSPRGSAFDDLSSVGSSNSTYTGNSAGGFSFSMNR